MKKAFVLFAFIFSTSLLIAQNTYIYCGKLIDTESGKVLKKKTIEVSGNKIQNVYDGYIKVRSKNATYIDLKDKVVMPGLIDMHVHIESEHNPKTRLEK